MLKCPLCTLESLLFFLKHYPAIYRSLFLKKNQLKRNFQFFDKHHRLMPWLKCKFFSCVKMSFNRPFPSSCGALYQNEVKCSAFDMEMIFHSQFKYNSFSQESLCTWLHFESEGFEKSEVAYFIVCKSLTCLKTWLRDILRTTSKKNSQEISDFD